MPKFLVLGAGKMGAVLARDLVLSGEQNVVILVDINSEKLKNARSFIMSDRLIPLQRNIEDRKQMAGLFEDAEVALSALLHNYSLPVLDAAIRHGCHLVDLVGDRPLERLARHEEAEKKGIIVIPGCGLAPGIDNICVGRGVFLLDETDEALIYVGGNPIHPQPPLKYSILYAVESLLDFYERKALIFEESRIKEVEALSGIESVEFSYPFSRMECFYTDGLSSLIHTMQGKVKHRLAEKTVRYSGHADTVKALKECGLFSRKPIRLKGGEVIPREILCALLEEKWKLGKDGDVTLMRVIVSGRKNRKKVSHVFEMVDLYDPERQYTSMAKTTCFPASIAAQMITAGLVAQRGVLFPENVFHSSLYRPFMKALKERGAVVTHKIITSKH